MTETVENPMLGHLKHFQGPSACLKKLVGDVTIRRADTPIPVLTIRHDRMNASGISTCLGLRLNEVRDRLALIERRLDMANGRRNVQGK